MNILRKYFKERIEKEGSTVETVISSTITPMDDIKAMANELKEKDSELIREKEKYSNMYSMLISLIDALPDYIWAKDLDGNFLLTNKKLRDDLLGGCTYKEALEGSAESFSKGTGSTIHIDCRRTDNIILKTKRKGIFIEKGEIEGKYTALLTHKAPIVDKYTGVVVGTVGSGRNVTEDYKGAEYLLAKTMNVIKTCPRVCSVNAEQVNTLLDIKSYLENLMNACKVYGGEHGGK